MAYWKLKNLWIMNSFEHHCIINCIYAYFIFIFYLSFFNKLYCVTHLIISLPLASIMFVMLCWTIPSRTCHTQVSIIYARFTNFFSFIVIKMQCHEIAEWHIPTLPGQLSICILHTFQPVAHWWPTEGGLQTVTICMLFVYFYRVFQ